MCALTSGHYFYDNIVITTVIAEPWEHDSIVQHGQTGHETQAARRPDSLI